MVDEGKLRNWVEGKLDNDADPEILRKSLENEGLDPYIVDKVLERRQEEKIRSFEEKLGKNSEDKDNSTDTSLLSLPNVSKPDVGKLKPEINTPDIDTKELLPSKSFLTKTMAVFAILGLVYGGYGFLDSSNIISAQEGCPDVGVSIDSVSTSSGVVTADVTVSHGTADVILEIYGNGEVVEYTTDRLSGSGTMTVESNGEMAVFRPVGCNRFRDSEMLH